jgi:hypothetical protein
MTTLSSKIISGKRISNVYNLYIEVWAKNKTQDNLLGSSFTNAQGDFSIMYEENSSLRGSSSTDVYVKIYRNMELLQSTKDKPVAIQRNTIPDVTLEEDKEDDGPVTNCVLGIIATSKGRGIENLVVRAYNKTMRAEIFLSEGKTNSKGEYSLYYQPSDAALQRLVEKRDPKTIRITGKKNGTKGNGKQLVVTKSETDVSNGVISIAKLNNIDVDLVIKVYTTSDEKEPIITSPLIINALQSEIINLSVGEETYRGLDTYTILHEGMEGSVTPETLKDLSTRDALILANTYNLPVVDVSYYIQARRWEVQWKELSAEVYFGWFKTGLPLQWAKLLSTPIEKLVSSIDEAVAENYIPDATQKQKQGLEEKIKQWRTDNIITAKGQYVERASVGELLGTSKLTNVQKRQLLHQWQNFAGTVDEFWKAQERSLGKEQYRDLELTLQLGAVTRNHLPLIQSIKNKIKLKRIHDLATLKEKDWLKMIKDDAIEVPSDIPGKDQKSKQKVFASQLRRITEELLPTAVLAQSFRDDKKVDSTALDLFMERNPEFEFRNTTVGAYLKENPNALGDINNKEEVQKELEAVQRIFHLTPTQEKYKGAKILWQNQLHSAYAIKMRGQEELLELYKGDRALAENIYNRASMRHSRSQMIKMQLESTYNVPGYTWVPSDGMAELVKKYFSANLEALFGDQGFCACKHCDSFFSPSAYLTDLFLYLSKVKVSGSGTAPSEDTALEKLFKRRQDLGNIQLNCKNSHTPLPYIDLVNEVLEAKVVPAFYTTKTVNIFGKTYTLPIKATPQTESDAATLKAYPQHIKEQAYTILRTVDNDQSNAFPWILPFNLWMFEVRTYLNHLGISRADLMGSVLGGSILTRVIAAEYLAINPEERAILNDDAANSSATKKYWNATITELRHVDTLMKKSGYSYDKLTKLLEMRYVQPVDDIVFTPASSCSVKDASIPGLNHEALGRMHKFGRLLLKTNEDMYMLDRAIMAFGGEINNTFLIHYANTLRIEKLLKVKIDRRELLSWWAMIDRHDYKDVPSLYTKLFMIPKKFNEFLLTASKEELLSPGTVIDLQAPPLAPDLLAAILSATRLKASDLQLLIDGEFPGGVFTLNLSQLSYLYSVASFCRATKLTIPEYLALKNIMGTEPVTNLNEQGTPARSLSFIKKYNTIKEIGFETEALQYILKHRARPNAPFVITDEEIDKILKLLQSAINTQLKEVFPTGTTTREIVETKLKIIIGTNDAENIARVLVIQNIIAGSSTLPIQEQNDVIDQQMIFFLDKQDAKNKLTGGGINTSEDRFLFALQALDRFLLESAIIQNLSESLALPQHIMMPLLQRLVVHPSDATKRTIDVFLDDPFVNADPKITWTRVELVDQFSVVIKLHKLSLLISALDLALSDLVFLMENGSIPGLPNFNALPVQETSDVVEIDSWISMFNIILLSREIFKGTDSAFYILSLSLDNTMTLDSFIQKLSELSGWKSEDLHYLVGPEKMNLTFPQDYTNGAWLLKIGQALKLVDKIGATAKQMASWTTTQIEKEHADAVRHAAMAKYSEKQWHEITVPLRHNIREAQRDALVQFVLHHRTKHTGAKFIDLDDIYSYFLIDTQMAACTDTSRIVLAASSVQLFVQRIMMNLESGMSLTKEFMKEWKWRRYYRVWEANRKVFMWPENWIEPELRDDKTPLFKELENELMQNELSSLNVENAYVNYLEKLHQVSHLKICGVYEDGNVSHVIGKSSGVPIAYYYRRWENECQWTAWEKIDLDISNGEEMEAILRGILMTPVAHNRRLFLFWPIFKIKKVEPTEEDLHLIEDKKKDIDKKNSEIRAKERKITQRSNEIDSLKKTRDDIENIQKKIPYPQAINWEDILEDLDDRIQAKEDKIADALTYITNKKASIRKLEDKIRDLEKGYHRYHISMAWSQYRDGMWSPKKVSQKEIKTPIFIDAFRNANWFKNYAVIPIHSSAGSLLLKIIYTTNKAVYSLDNFFIFDDCKSEIDVNYADGSNSNSNNNYYTPYSQRDNLTHALSFEKSLYLQKPLNIINDSEQEILLLEKTFVKGGIIKSLQAGLYKTVNAFFYEDESFNFFIKPPSTSTATLASVIKTQMLNSGGSTLQNSVNRLLLPPEEQEYKSSKIQFTDSQTGSKTFFNASDSGRVIVKTKEGVQAGTSENTGAVEDLGASINLEFQKDLSNKFNGQAYALINGYTFYPFYHPYTCLFLKQLNSSGIEGLLSPSSYSEDGKELIHQATPGQKTTTYFKEKYLPNLSEVNWQHMKEEIDFTHGNAYATYNWELFYHIPLFIATRLSQDQRFDEAQNWFHYIFDPTETQGEVPYRFWKIKPFHTYTVETMKADIKAVMEGKESIKKQIEAWERNPFNPHLLARYRRLAYMKTVVMKYLDNLIAWGDQLFRMDTIESMNEATQLYVLAGQILGKLPVETQAKERASKSFNQLAEDLTQMGNAWVSLENGMTNEYEESYSSYSNTEIAEGINIVSGNQNNGTYSIDGSNHKRRDNYLKDSVGRKVKESTGKTKSVNPEATTNILTDILYFCMSPNEKLLSYWDTVADRLFKIRNCMNIEGLIRSVPLFQPPIDPALLVKAAAAGVDISSAINDLYAPMPYYRFQVLIQKAQALCQELKSLGGTLLSALEKKDAEQLSLIRSQHEIQLLEANKDVRKQQLEEARLAIASLEESYKLAQIRFNNYSGRESMNTSEIASTTLSATAILFEIIAGVSATTAAAVSQIPDIKISTHAQGMSSGSTVEIHPPGSGDKSEKSAMSFSSFFGLLASVTRQTSGILATQAGYERRTEEWELQIDLAQQEMKQIDKQILGALIREQIATKEKDNLDLQIENSKQADAYMRNKYTNQELYNWFIGQVSSIYFQTYKMAYDMAKQAEKAFRFELGIESSNYIQFGYWDNLRKGLLSGEKLFQDLNRLDVAYLEKNKRDYEITKHISLSLVSPTALIKLKETGICEFDIPELLFDLDYAGQYFRRIKSVSITIPCIVGPYTSVSAKLTLLKNRVRKNGNSQTPYAYTGIEDSNFTHNLVGMQSVATSQAQGDSGMFELNFKDERYLPFEGAGVISTWRLELPVEFRSFDYDTISDAILHMNYTSRDGGDALKQTVNTHVNDTLNKWMDEASENETGLVRLISMRQEFSNDWHRFFDPKLLNDEQQISLHQLEFEIKEQHFPYFLRKRELSLMNVTLMLKLRNEEDSALAIGLPLKLVQGQGDSAVFVDPLTNDGLQSGVANLPSLTYETTTSPLGWWKVQIDNDELPDSLKVDQANNIALPAALDRKKVEDLYFIFNYTI